MIQAKTTPFQEHFITLAGDIAEMIAFNRSIGQLYGLLYVALEPLSLEDIAGACKMSKGNASIHLRILEGWGAVHRSTRTGTRRDYYTANTDLRGLALKRLQEGIEKRLNQIRAKFKSIREDPSFADHLSKEEGMRGKERLEEIESILEQIEKGCDLLPKLLQLKVLF